MSALIDLRGLPRPSGRWTVLDKHAVVLAVQRGQITFNMAVRRFDLSDAELQGWINRYRARGVDGLAVLKTQGARP